MGWRDWLRRKRQAPRPHHLIRGDDVALFAPESISTALEIELGREGIPCRIFSRDKGALSALEKSLPRAVAVVTPELELDWLELIRQLRKRELFGDLPVLLLAQSWSAEQSHELGETLGALCITGTDARSLATGLERWRSGASVE